MKRCILGLLLALVLSANSYAASMYWDLSTINYAITGATGPTDLYVAKDLGIRNDALRYPYTNIIADLGADNFLSDGDTFTEAGILGVLTADGDGFTFWDTEKNQRGYIYYEFLNLSGHLENVVFDIVTNEFTFDIIFDTVGDINLKYTTDSTFTVWDGLLATYSVLDAGTTEDGFTLEQGVGEGSGTFGFDLKVDTIDTNNFWYLTNSLNPAESLVASPGIYAMSTLTASLIELDTTSLANDNKWVLTVQNIGSIEHVVPEPSTMLLLGIGVLGLSAAARRRKN